MSLIPVRTQFVDYIAGLEDFPEPVNGVITLVDNTTYWVLTDVDLLGNRLVSGQNTTIIGGSSENCFLRSTGLDANVALITSAWSIPMRSLAITHGTALNLDASANANQAIDWFGVNFTNCATIGTIKGYNNFIASDCGFLNSSGLTFDGTIGTVGFSQCIFDAQAGGTVITLPATLTLTRRFRIIYSAFVVLSGETGTNASTSATIPVEGYILDNVNFAGGGTYVTGVAFNDNKARWNENRGVTNSSETAVYTMNGNVTATAIASQGVAVKAAGTTVFDSVASQKFTHTNNRATYVGAITRLFRVTGIVSLTAGNNNQIGVYVAKNGSTIASSETYLTANTAGRAENGVVQSIVSLAENEYIEIWVENDSAVTNITVSDLNVVVEALN